MSLTNDHCSHSAGPPLFEALEERLLLTTLVGGDVFEFLDADGDDLPIRIALEGDIIAEFIGGDVDRTDNEILPGENANISKELVRNPKK